MRSALSSFRGGRHSVSLWSVVAVVALVAAVVFSVAATTAEVAPRPRRTTGPRPGVSRIPAEEWPAAVARTVAAGSARIDAVYEPATGPPVRVSGVTSFVGPETEVAAGIDGEAPARVRVRADGAWVRAPGAEAWVALPSSGPGAMPIAGTRGWADLLRNLHPTSDVWVDEVGRVARVLMPRDPRGGRLDVRFSSYGTEVQIEPP